MQVLICLPARIIFRPVQRVINLQPVMGCMRSALIDLKKTTVIIPGRSSFFREKNLHGLSYHSSQTVLK